MLNSLATYLFGSQPKSESTSSEADPEPKANGIKECTIQAGDDVIEVTSLTPSVASTRGSGQVNSKPGKKSRRGKQPKQQSKQSKRPTNCADEDIDDDWCIIDNEEDQEGEKENALLPRNETEEELTVVEAPTKPTAALAAPIARRLHHKASHSLYSGPRPQQQRNYLQRIRSTLPLSGPALGPARTGPQRSAENDVTQSLFAPAPLLAVAAAPCEDDANGQDVPAVGALVMEESWYVTPPPCFTSIGPINMEASPFENLLIEHPSMSVYHSIRSSQAGIDNSASLDLRELQASQFIQQEEPTQTQLVPAAPILAERRNQSARHDRQAAAELKQQVLARQSQKSNKKDQHQQLCRSALSRTNKVRDPKANRHRRSDMQHFKVISGANNNRKCCF
ncbi:uncharacterized protein LOC115632138 isoform X1 [Scaptodrosophila lebanonensis]|uniref:Uncharacterized protein LOC115632138 isoform X1 n=1 Tax=Drosophila lebanonensis TaxID=7225 RepID=A0A6J2U9I6_DROLE|nr:uncharacterized protein LOC115632138 isoform X1 [Scaptodrosophila lebanonensis]XP_030385014.1 uncharacterized protein LOC115632138 isoform X1 [Scaptodrosophila lebanonensis]